MTILFHLPRQMLDHCFGSQDLARLQVEHTLLLPESSDAAVLLARCAQYAPQCDAFVTGWSTPPLTDALLEQAPQLKAIIHSAGSIKTLVPESTWRRGIRVATCNGALAIGVAETTLGLIIAGLKGFFPSRDWTAAGHWHDPQLGTKHVLVREPFDVTIGVIGASKVGRHLIQLLHNFEVDILVADPYLSEEEAAQLDVRTVTLESLMQGSDVVTLHAPALPSTRHLLKSEHFRAMKDGAIFINTARGMIVDEVALITELQTGRFAAFIDVTDPEPPAADHPFRTLPNVVLTPHIAGHASNGARRQGRSAIHQLLEFANGKAMSGEISEAMFRLMA